VGGVLADRVGIRRVAGTGAALMGLGGLLRGLANDFVTFLLVSALLGAGMGLTLPNLPKAIRGWFPRSLLGVASGIYVVGFPIGAMTAAGATGFVANAFGAWRAAFILWGGLVLAFAGIWWLVVREPRVRQHDAASSLRVPRLVSRNVYLWIIAAGLTTTTLMFGIEVAWFPALLAERGASTLDAGLLVSLLIAGNLVGVLTIPAASDRIGLRRPFLWGFGLLSILGLFVLILAPVSVAWMVLPLLGFAVSGPFTMGFVLPGDFIDYEHLGAASGIVLAMGWLGIAFGSLLTGLLRDVTGGFDSTLYALLVGAAITSLLAVPLPESGRKGRRHLAAP
jgi:cyanate permease